MPQKTLVIVCAVFIALLRGTLASAESDPDEPSWMPKPAPGEDALVVRRNAFMNKLAEIRNNRVTIVKFDDDLETKCPTLTSLFFSVGNTLELLTPNLSLGSAAQTFIYSEGGGPDGNSADFVVENMACRYVLTVKRYDRDGGAEREVQAINLPKIYKSRVYKTPPRGNQDYGIGFSESSLLFDSPSKLLNFTGAVFFSQTTLTVFLVSTEKDLAIASQSNFLTHSYKVQIENPDAAIRISIRKELYSNGQWVDAFGK